MSLIYPIIEWIKLPIKSGKDSGDVGNFFYGPIMDDFQFYFYFKIIKIHHYISYVGNISSNEDTELPMCHANTRFCVYNGRFYTENQSSACKLIIFEIDLVL